MAQLSFDSIGVSSEEIVIVRTGFEHKWKTIGLIALSILMLLVILIVTLVIRPRLVKNASVPISTMGNFNNFSTIEGSTLTSTKMTTTTTTLSGNNINTSYFQSQFFGYQTTSGLPLNKCLYYNIDHFASVAGYISSVSLRLFTSWGGSDPLYIFIVSAYLLDHRIVQRYSIYPEKNNREWQTFTIPDYRLRVDVQQYIAVGMQTEGANNTLYAVRSTFALYGCNITNEATYFYARGVNGFYGVALAYMLVPNQRII